MATWVQMQIQEEWFDTNGDPASGFVLKAYEPGTTTPVSIAIDSSGGSPQATITLNAEGKYEVSGNEITPYIDRDYKYAIFENATDAAANSNPFAGFYDNIIYDRAGDLSSLAAAVETPSDLLALSTTLAIGTTRYVYTSGKEGHWIVTAWTSEVDNEGTIKVDGTWSAAGKYWRRAITTPTNVKWFGAIGDGVTSDTAACQAAIDFGNRIYFPKGDYLANLIIDGRQGVILEGEAQGNDRLDQGGATRVIAESLASPAIRFGNGSNSVACGMRNLLIDANYDKSSAVTGTGVLWEAFAPSVVWRCFIEHCFIRGFATGFHIDCDINASEAFNNRIEDVEVIGALNYGFRVRGVYNLYSKCFATQVEDFAFFNDGSNSDFSSIIGDGRMAFKGGGQQVTNAVIEAIHATVANPAASPAFEINGNTSSFRGIRLNGVQDTDYELGITVFGAQHTIENVVIQGVNQSREPIRLNSASSGTLNTVTSTVTTNYIDGVSSLSTLRDWQFLGDVSDVYRDPTIRLFESEQSWTPVLDRFTTSPSVTYLVQQGNYTKFGNLVVATGFINASAVSGGSGIWQITGLPFTSSNLLTSIEYDATVGHDEILACHAGYIPANTSFVFLTQDGAVFTGAPSTGKISITAVYMTDE